MGRGEDHCRRALTNKLPSRLPEDPQSWSLEVCLCTRRCTAASGYTAVPDRVAAMRTVHA